MAEHPDGIDRSQNYERSRVKSFPATGICQDAVLSILKDQNQINDKTFSKGLNLSSQWKKFVKHHVKPRNVDITEFKTPTGGKFPEGILFVDSPMRGGTLHTAIIHEQQVPGTSRKVARAYGTNQGLLLGPGTDEYWTHKRKFGKTSFLRRLFTKQKPLVELSSVVIGNSSMLISPDRKTYTLTVADNDKPEPPRAAKQLQVISIPEFIKAIDEFK